HNHSLHDAITISHEQTMNIPEKVLPGIRTGKQPLSELEQIENDIGKQLNIGAHHPTRIASMTKNRVKSIENYWKDSYKKFLEDIKNNKVHLPESQVSNYKMTLDDFNKAISEGRVDPRTNKIIP